MLRLCSPFRLLFPNLFLTTYGLGWRTPAGTRSQPLWTGSTAYLREVLTYWQHDFEWQQQEARRA
nr:hypothetical protein [Hymenobacter terricola]